ncbi:MAG: response regulator, partial [Paludibacter sp.]|nr:response regulator [Paludibacter sp.]
MKRFLTIFLVCIPIISLAQTGTLYTTDNYLLSSSLINAIYQDKRDYVWIATEDGLNRFDGVRFEAYKNIQNDSTSIANNYVRSLFEDSQGRFWIGCINALNLYDRVSNSFAKIKVYDGNNLANPHITKIIESRNHDIWMSTSGLGVIRLRNGEKTPKIETELSARLNSLHLTDIFEDSKGRFWIASEYNGLNLYNPINDAVMVYREPTIGSNQISVIAEDKYGHLFVGTLNGLFRFNEQNNSFEKIAHVTGQNLSIQSIMFDNNERLLAGTDGEGVKIYAESSGLLYDREMLQTAIDLSKMKVHALMQDRQGNFWMGFFQKGAFIEQENTGQFRYFGRKSFNRNIIGSSCVLSLAKDQNDNLWIGTDNDGVYRVGKNSEAKHYLPTSANGKLPNTVFAIVAEKNGDLWLGSYLQGLALLNAQTEKCTYFPNNFEQANENPASNKIICVIADDNNQLWIGTNGDGIYVFDLTTRQFVEHYSSESKKNIPNNWINCICRDVNGKILCGSYGGYFQLNPLTGQIEKQVAAGVLPGNVVYSIYPAQDGKLWIGTSEGLACYNPTTDTAVKYTISDGLPSNVICAIQSDGAGDLWISTHSGISKMNVAESSFTNYYSFDGLQGNEFSMGSACKSLAGELFFGGTGGVTSFFPAQINDRKSTSNVQLTNLFLADKRVISGQKSKNITIFNGFIADADTIRLAYIDNNPGFEFSTFDFGFAEKIQYRYFLEGFSNTWITTERGINRINFTNLNYGTYRLHITATVNNNASTEKIITIIIAAPPYLSFWAKLLYLSILILLFSAVFYWIKRRRENKNERIKREHEQLISEAKLKFFINIAHEIRTPMTLISAPLEQLIRENENPILAKSYALMQKNVQRILQLINQLMDVRKIDKGQMPVRYAEIELVAFIDDIMQTFGYQAEKQNIHFVFEHQVPNINVWIDANHFDKTLFNLLSNAFKFTPQDGEIIVKLTVEAENFLVQVLDTGPGIEENKTEKIFERFYQIENVAQNRNGTGVGLNLARSLVELMHGMLTAQNRNDCKGSCFTVTLPLGKAFVNSNEIEDNVNSLSQGEIINDDNQRFFLDVRENIEWSSENNRPKFRLKSHYKIMIVDDEEDIRGFLGEQLADRYRLAFADNGKDAYMDILKSPPDLVLSDVMMPETDGITLTRKLKQNPKTKQIPIILLSAKAGDYDKAEGFETGADAYVSKPFNVELLKKIIENMLENRERLKERAADSEENKDLIKPVTIRPADQLLYERIC